MNQPTVGILPLWLKLYDDLSLEHRPRIEGFIRTLAESFEKRGVTARMAPVCRVRPEFAAAVRRFEADGVDGIVTVHLAYSPSLESSGVLTATRLPILVLDTTPTWSFGPGQDPGEIDYNHGIHGVQDLCSLLVRGHRPFLLEAGHWERSDVIDRIVRHLPSARMAARIGRGRVGLLGEPFPGMGDFFTPPRKLERTLGTTVHKLTRTALRSRLRAVTEDEIRREMDEDRERFEVDPGTETGHTRSIRLGLALRAWMEHERLDAFSFNFLHMTGASGYPTAPFLEASKAMARGLGYAGEGDVLTAMLVGAVSSAHPETTFTEMFCPDWQHGTVFLSHMGEVNWRLLRGKGRLRVMEEYTYSKTAAPALVTGCLRPGQVVLTDLAPMANDTYRLILAPGEMLDAGEIDRMGTTVRGWLRPRLPLSEFLAAYSRAGGTHHLALTYTDTTESLQALGRLMGWETVVIG